MEERGAVRAREDADLDRERPDVLQAPAVRSDALVEDGAADLLLEERVEGQADVRLADRIAGGYAPLGPPTGHQRGNALALELVEADLALRLVGVADLATDPVLEELGDPRLLGWIDLLRRPLDLRLSDGADERLLRGDELRDGGLRKPQCFDEPFLGHLVRARLEHHDRVAGAGDDEIHLARLELLDRGIQRERAVDRPDPNAADRSVERRVRDREGGGRGVHREDVGFVLLVGAERRDDDLDVVAEPLREKRPDGSVGESCGEDALLGRPALAARERAGDLAGRVEALLEVDGEREEVDAGPDGRRDRGRREDDRVAVTDGDRATGLLGQLSGLEDEGLAVDDGLGSGYRHVVFARMPARDLRGAHRRRPSRPRISW